MAGKVTGVSRKRAKRAKAARSVERARGERSAKAKPDVPKSRAAAMRLAVEVDALRAELEAARARVAALETKVVEDPLTGLVNRHGLERVLRRALAYVRRYGSNAALVYLDLDRFKPINDRLGHAAGDWVLGRVARLVLGHVRASDVVARVGGDEFVVLLWNLNLDQARDKARGLEALIDKETFEHAGKRLALGLSAGVTLLSGNDTVEAALARADAAMYARKRERRMTHPSS